MSDRSLISSIFIAVLCALQPAWAQPARPAEDSAHRNIARLESLLQERQGSYDSLRRALASRATWITLREPPYQVQTTPELSSVVATALALAQRALGDAGGDTLRLRLSRRLPTIAAESRVVAFYREWVTWLAPDTGAGRWVSSRTVSATRPSATDIATQLINLSERVVTEGADSALSAWLKGTIPLVTAPRSEWEEAYRELATTPSRTTRDCRAGAPMACLTALGVTRGADSWLDAWYSPQDYRALLGSTQVPAADTLLSLAAARCRAGEDASCPEAARRLPASAVPMPLSADVRRLLLGEALHAGGPHAVDRLLATRGSISDRLAAAANMTAPELASRWLSRVSASRPESVSGTPTLFIATLAWCGLLTGLAVVRRGTWS